MGQTDSILSENEKIILRNFGQLAYFNLLGETKLIFWSTGEKPTKNRVGHLAK